MAETLTIRANAGETIDALVDRAIGRTSGAVEAVLAANPGLARLALALPEGTAVLVPVAAQVFAETLVIQLWD